MERGVALLIVLWMLALLALIVAGFTMTSHSNIQLARNQVDSARARALADAGVTRAIVGLTQPGLLWLADGRIYDWQFGGGDIQISIQDEGGKISLNAAPPAVLQSAFAYAGSGDDLGASLAAAIIDRRERRLGPSTDDLAFAMIEDLETVPGMTAQLYFRVAPLLSPYARSPQVDPTTAPRDVLMALPNADPVEIDTYLAARATRGTAQPSPLPTLLSVGRYVAQGQAGVVTIHARATTDTGAVFIREATVSLQARGTRPFTTLAWSQVLAGP